MSGKVRELLSAPGTLTLHDVGPSGQALISRDALRAGAIGLAPGESKERDLSWQDWTVPIDISNDGKLILFIEAGEAGGGEYAVFTRDTTGVCGSSGPGFRLLFARRQVGFGLAPECVPSRLRTSTNRCGAAAAVSTGSVIPELVGQFFSDSKRILFQGHEPGHADIVFM